MKKILQVIGTRPNIIKLIDMADTFDQRLLWTGQHYSPELSKDLSDEFGIVFDAGYKCTELWRMVSVVEDYIKSWKPDCVVVYGDTRTTLAGAMAAFDAKAKLAHVEAGLRLREGTRYEDKVRRAIDGLADFLFAPTQEAMENLLNEGSPGKVYNVGDIHYERYLQNRRHEGYILLTVHRQETVDDKKSLQKIMNSVAALGRRVVFPAHPRTLGCIEKFKTKMPKNIVIVPPMNYKTLQDRIRMAELVVTDSGGIIREATFAGTPVYLLGRSEWEEEIHRFGDGNTSQKIKNILKGEL
jgi:UDP-GlcNAc3NAcA epimerase